MLEYPPSSFIFGISKIVNFRYSELTLLEISGLTPKFCRSKGPENYGTGRYSDQLRNFRYSELTLLEISELTPKFCRSKGPENYGTGRYSDQPSNFRYSDFTTFS